MDKFPGTREESGSEYFDELVQGYLFTAAEYREIERVLEKDGQRQAEELGDNILAEKGQE